MTNVQSELFARDGYVQFPSAVPVSIRDRCIGEINSYSDEYFYWKSPLAEEFRTWFREFLGETCLGIYGESDLCVFNRVTGNFMHWHCDSAGGDVNYGRRVFCCAYMTDTFSGGGALKVIPGSHSNSWKSAASMKHRLSQFVADQDKASYTDLHPEMCYKEGELTLEMAAGTVLIADERIWHAVCTNKKSCRRTMVLWWRWRPIINSDD